MSLKIGSHLFTGPFDLKNAVTAPNHHPRVFAIVCRAGAPWNPTFRLIDLGVTPPGGWRPEEDAARQRWELENDGKLGVYFFELDPFLGQDRNTGTRIAAEIRTLYPPPHAMIPIHGGQ